MWLAPFCSAMQVATESRYIRTGFLILIFISLAFWSMLGCGGTGSPESPGKKATVSPKPIEHLERTQYGFPLLKTPPESLPPLVRKPLEQRPIHGLNWRMAQVIPIKAPQKVWAVPGNNFLCLLDLQRDRRRRPSVGAVCSTTTLALKRGLAVTFLSNPATGSPRTTRLIVGIAPQRATTVDAYSKKETVTIQVRRGIFIRRDSNPSAPGRIVLGTRPNIKG